MEFDQKLILGTLVKRYKRFLADVQLSDGTIITAHTANTGAMTGCCEPGSRVWLSCSDNPKRKYAHTWEIVEVTADDIPVLVGINTMRSNALVREAIETGVVSELSAYSRMKSEVKYGEQGSRIDLLLSAQGLPDCYVEVKNVTLAEQGVAYFPDAVSKRALKHVQELQAMVTQGVRAVIFFCVQRTDVELVKPAAHIDSEYAQALQHAVNTGLEVLAYRAELQPWKIALQTPLPVSLS